MKEYRAMGQRTLECYKQSLLGYFHGNLQGHNAHLDSDYEGQAHEISGGKTLYLSLD